MIMLFALALVWAAAGYRVWLTLVRPRAVWRTSFTITMVCTAVAITLWHFRETLDTAFGSWNLGNLLAHAVFTVGTAFLLIYVAALRRPDISSTLVHGHLLGAAGVIAIQGLCWATAPIHDRSYASLAPMTFSSAVVGYYVSFYAYLGLGLIETARTCFSRARSFGRTDKSRSTSLMMTGSAAVTGLFVLTCWSLSLLLYSTLGDRAIVFSRLGDGLVPIPLLLLSSGVLVLLFGPWLVSVITASRRWRVLRPLWRDLVRRFPQIHLNMRPRGGPLSRMQTREARALIEIHDALRVARIDVDGDPTTTAIASAPRSTGVGQRAPADLLQMTETREADLEQILALARAWARVG